MMVLCPIQQLRFECNLTVRLPNQSTMKVTAPKPASDPFPPERSQHAGFCCGLTR